MLNEKITVLGLPESLCNTLRKKNIKTVGELLIAYRSGILMDIRNIGTSKLNLIKEALDTKLNISVQNEKNKELKNLGFTPRAISKLNRLGCYKLDDILKLKANHLNQDADYFKEIETILTSLGYTIDKDIKLTPSSPIIDLDFYPAVITSFKKRNIQTIKDLLDYPKTQNIEKEMLDFRNLGSSRLQELFQILKDNGFTFTIIKTTYLEEQLAKIPTEQLLEEFCININTISDFESSPCILNFIKKIMDDDTKPFDLANEEVSKFLLKKVLESKKNLYTYLENIEEGLKLK